MNALWELPHYWLNFLLHTAVLSAFAAGLCLLLRDPGRRAFAAAAGILAIALLPWITAKGLLPQWDAPVRQMAESAVPREEDFSGWVVRIEKPVTVTELRAVEVMEAPESVGTTPTDWLKVLAALWISGAVIGLSVVIVRHAALSMRLRPLRKPDEPEWASLSQHATRSHETFLISGNEVGPCAAGLLRQRIVLPADMVAEGGGRLRWTVRHEEEHLRSSDPRVAVLLSLAKCALWWNPLVHVLGHLWMECRERVCDARALDRPEEGRNYGAFLLAMTEAGAATGGLPMAGGGARRLRKRIHALLGGRTVAPGSNTSRFTIIGLLSSGALLACCFGVEEKDAPPAVVPPHEGKAEITPVQIAAAKEGGEGLPVRITQTKISAMYLRTDSAIPEAGSVLSEMDADLMMRRLAEVEGVYLMASPSVLAKDGNTAETYAINTRPEDAGVENGKVRDVPFVGVSLRVAPAIKGGKVSLSVDCLVNHEPDRLPLEYLSTPENPEGRLRIPARDFDWTTVRSATAMDTKELSAGESMVVAFKGTREGVHLTGIFTAVPIDATGREYDNFDHSVAKLKPGVDAVTEPEQMPAPSPVSGKAGEQKEGADGGNDGRRIKLTSKLILADGEIPETGKVMQDTEVMALLGKLSKEDSIKFMTTPSVITRNGQRSQVEMIWKSPDARGADESEVEKRKAPFAGLSVESTAVSAGDKIELSYDAIYNHQSGQPGLIFSGKFPEEIPADFDWSKLRSSQAKGRVTLKSGETFMAPFTHVEPGKHLVVVFSVHEIDVTGRRLRTDGKFRIRSVIVTLPRGGRLPSYWFQIPAFPAEGQQEPPPSALLYPTRHLADMRKEAMAAGGETAWQDVGEAIAKDGEEASFGRDGRSKIRAAFWDGYGCRITMDLQNYERRFVASGHLGQISGIELEPTENGNRQVLLFALDEVK